MISGIVLLTFVASLIGAAVVMLSVACLLALAVGAFRTALRPRPWGDVARELESVYGKSR